MPSNPRWTRIEALFDQALELPAQERLAWLAEACPDDEGVRREVEDMVAAHERSAGILEGGPGEASGSRHDDGLAAALRQAIGQAAGGAGESEQPTQIGAFQVRRRLGAGGMGEVFLAYDHRLDREVAIKRMRHDLAPTPEHRERFRREARAAASLNHPNIVRIYDILEESSGDNIVMEYVAGRSLSRLLAAGEVDGPTALDLARQITGGLARAHAQGLIHRDLKTENVMVTPEGEAKILDFGLAKPIVKANRDASLTGKGLVLGTARTMSPEQARGEEVDARSDLFSLGVLLYEMFTGKSPFQGESPMQVLLQVQLLRPPPPLTLRPQLPLELSSLIEKLLEKDPERRPQEVGQVARALADMAELPGLERLAAPSHPDPSGLPAPTHLSTPWRPLDPVNLSPLSEGPLSEGNEDAPSPGPAAARGFGAFRWRRWAWAVTLVGLASAANLVYFLLPPTRRPVTVAVLDPEVRGSDEGIELVAFGVHDACVKGLTRLQGLEAIKPSDFGTSSASAVEVARAVAADEVLLATVVANGELSTVSLRRIRGSDGRVLASSAPFEVRTRDYWQLANAVELQVRQAYPDNPPHPGFPEIDVRREDYQSYLELLWRTESGRRVELEEIQKIIATSPRFVDGYLLAADQARIDGELDLALEYIGHVQRLAPGDPRGPLLRFRIELAGAEIEQAEATLAELERLGPGDVRVLASRARLAQHEGRLQEAVQVRREIVELRPSWLNLYHLAVVEMDAGDVEASRSHLQELLRVSPHNRSGRVRLAELELLYGGLEQAESLYRSLVETHPESYNFTNLGLVFFLQRNYEMAAESFRRSLDLEPGQVMARLKLADIERVRGNGDKAREMYRVLAEELQEEGSPSGPDRFQALIKAQCLVHDDAFAAVEVIRETRRRYPEDVRVLYVSALVDAVADQPISALVYAAKARDLGMQSQWFQVPAFDSLRSNPKFKELMAGAPPADD